MIKSFHYMTNDAQLAWSCYEEPKDPVVIALTELINFQDDMRLKLINARKLVLSGAYKYSTVEARKALLDDLTSHADNTDDMTRAVIKGIRRIKRERLRDDELIQKLVHFWAISHEGPIAKAAIE